MPECMDVIRERRSIRKFENRIVDKDKIENLIDAARMAPSAGNLQARDFIIVQDKITRQKLKKAALGQSFIEQAPVVIVALANFERSTRVYKSRGELYAIQDAAAAIENLLLAACAMGFGSCWVGAFDEEEVREILDIPDKILPVAMIPLGYPNEHPEAPPRLVSEKMIHWDKW